MLLMQLQLELVPLSSPERIEIRKLFTDDRYNKLLDCIQADLDFTAFAAKMEFSEFLYSEEINRRAMEGFKKASRLAVALEVLKEYADDKKDLCTLRSES